MELIAFAGTMIAGIIVGILSVKFDNPDRDR